jgi:hypothetical protein
LINKNFALFRIHQEKLVILSKLSILFLSSFLSFWLVGKNENGDLIYRRAFVCVFVCTFFSFFPMIKLSAAKSFLKINDYNREIKSILGKVNNPEFG